MTTPDQAPQVPGVRSYYRCPDCGYEIQITHTPDWTPSPCCPEESCDAAPDMRLVREEDAVMPHSLPPGRGILAS